ncbi:MAG: hypothetical protein R8K46_07130 [Mariprofundaceae bacterium]
MGEKTAQEKWMQVATGQGRASEGFAKPYHVAVHKGRIHVTDTLAQKVLVFDVPNRRSFSIGGGDGRGALTKPIGIDIDDNGMIYVADVSGKRVVMYNEKGKFVRDFGAKATLVRPSGVAVNAEGTRVFAVDTGGVASATEEHRVRVYEVATGKHLFDIGSRGGEEGKFNLPLQAAMGPDGNLYVLDSGNFRIQVFDQEGNFIRKFGKVGRNFGDFARPKAISVGPDGMIYVVDTAFSNFQIFTPEGQLLMFIGGRGASGMPGIYQLPSGIDVDEDGRVYMIDQFFRKMDIFRPNYTPEDTGYLVTGEKAPRTEGWDVPTPEEIEAMKAEEAAKKEEDKAP